MDLVALTYTSRSAPELTPRDVDDIHRAALTYNPLDGVTGLLVYNGVGFMQIIEGADSAIEDLMKRIMADTRHRDVVVQDRRSQPKRCFANWSMYRVDVDPSFKHGLSGIEDAVFNMIDVPMQAIVRSSLAAISMRP